jgi:hypothetical protein
MLKGSHFLEYVNFTLKTYDAIKNDVSDYIGSGILDEVPTKDFEKFLFF